MQTIKEKWWGNEKNHPELWINSFLGERASIFAISSYSPIIELAIAIRKATTTIINIPFPTSILYAQDGAMRTPKLIF